MSKKEVYVDRIRCKGCGACEEVAPSAFKVEEGNTAEFLGTEDIEEEELLQAANICPTKCIEVEDS